MSPEQQRQKAAAREESLNHLQYANVMHPRNGRDHEDHKLADLSHESEKEEMAEHGMKVERGVPR